MVQDFIAELRTEHTAKQIGSKLLTKVDILNFISGLRTSEKTAKEQAHENLSKPMVQSFIAELRTEQIKSHKVQVDDVILRLMREADNEDTGTGGSRVAALAHLGKHLGRFTDKVEVDAPRIETITRVIVNAADYDDSNDDDGYTVVVK